MEQEQPKTVQIDINLLQATVAYLQKQPYEEVYQILGALLQSAPRPVQAPAPEVKEEKKEE